MDPTAKVVMEAYLPAATRNEPGHECVRAAVESWTAVNPAAPIGAAAERVYEILRSLRLVDVSGPDHIASPEEAGAVVAAFRHAKEIGLHPDNCLAQAVDLWLRTHPAEDRATAERRVTRLIDQSDAGAA
jgi:hypothetical protein